MIPGSLLSRENWRPRDRQGKICDWRGTARCLEERLKQIVRTEGIELQRLRRQVAFDRFLVRMFEGADTQWVLKGGYAMELRFQIARATKDLDFTVRTISGFGDSVLGYLQEVGRRKLDDFFSFRVGSPMMDLDGAPYGGSRYPVDATMAGRTFVKFHMDVGIGARSRGADADTRLVCVCGNSICICADDSEGAAVCGEIARLHATSELQIAGSATWSIDTADPCRKLLLDYAPVQKMSTTIKIVAPLAQRPVIFGFPSAKHERMKVITESTAATMKISRKAPARPEKKRPTVHVRKLASSSVKFTSVAAKITTETTAPTTPARERQIGMKSVLTGRMLTRCGPAAKSVTPEFHDEFVALCALFYG
jgi:hypothetical protein